MHPVVRVSIKYWKKKEVLPIFNFVACFLAAFKALVSLCSSYAKNLPLQFVIRIKAVHLT
jgi:hypothetical protein